MTGSKTDKLFEKRKLQIGFWNCEKRLVSSQTANFEKVLACLGEVTIEELDKLEDLQNVKKCDLLIILAQHLEDSGFSKWLAGVAARVKRVGGIWTPALMVSDVSLEKLNDIWPQIYADNWYIDIVDPDHIASLPIRVANLLRIHDHLHELKRYNSELEALAVKVKELEAQMAKLHE